MLENTSKINTRHKEIRQMIQTEKETIREDEIPEEVETRKHLLNTLEKRGNIRLQKITNRGEKDVEIVKRRTTLQKFADKIQEISYTNYSIWKSHPAMSRNTLLKL